MARQTEQILGIDLFSYDNWDDIDIDILQFYNVKFCFDSLKKYNGGIIGMKRNGDIEVFIKDAFVKINLFEVPEFVEEIKKRINK